MLVWLVTKFPLVTDVSLGRFEIGAVGSEF